MQFTTYLCSTFLQPNLGPWLDLLHSGSGPTHLEFWGLLLGLGGGG